MECPVCGQGCVKEAHEIIALIEDVFKPCPECPRRVLNKNEPPPDGADAEPCACACGRRFIDEVFVHIYAIMVEEGDLHKTDPLKSVGMPLIHPGFAMRAPPYLPADSLVLLSPHITKKTALRLHEEVPEIKGVVRSSEAVPGLSDIDKDNLPDTYDLLAGCDVRANVFYSQTKPLIIYKQQSLLHIEFPRGYDPKIISVGSMIRKRQPEIFVDACSGAGTLGLLGALMGVPHVIMNDIWYAAAFWSACNIRVNQEHLGIDDVIMHADYDGMKARPVVEEPVKIAESTGSQVIEVYQGNCMHLHTVIPHDIDLAVIDLFEKRDPAQTSGMIREWKKHVNGDVFIP